MTSDPADSLKTYKRTRTSDYHFSIDPAIDGPWDLAERHLPVDSRPSGISSPVPLTGKPRPVSTSTTTETYVLRSGSDTDGSPGTPRFLIGRREDEYDGALQSP